MATIFKSYQDRVDKEIEEQSGGAPAAPKAPAAPAKPGFDFFKQGPVDPEVEAARKAQRARMLRNR
jgi:hypothetical protein